MVNTGIAEHPLAMRAALHCRRAGMVQTGLRAVRQRYWNWRFGFFPLRNCHRHRRWLQSHLHLAERQRFTERERFFSNWFAVYERAIARPKVADHYRVTVHANLAVHARDRRVIDLKIVVL